MSPSKGEKFIHKYWLLKLKNLSHVSMSLSAVPYSYPAPRPGSPGHMLGIISSHHAKQERRGSRSY